MAVCILVIPWCCVHQDYNWSSCGAYGFGSFGSVAKKGSFEKGSSFVAKKHAKDYRAKKGKPRKQM